MEIYLIIVVVLFVLAISDLVVGVSNDAVNFLNSAVGSKVAPRHIILIVASAGVFIGAAFSGGLMEVARKGIFNPEQFYLPEIMTIFLAVMLTDVILLDLYNTFALPTSTTVSIVFELLGASVMVSILKIVEASEGINELIRYINTSKALAIISGILISVAVAFTVGALIQFIVRLVFTFDFEKRIKRYGAIWGGISLSFITFFILVKGAKGSTFIDPQTADWIKSNSEIILLYNFLFWTVIFQLLTWFTKVNILKPVVLVGTFALALAFAANDLVNFIGVPLAGFSTYLIGLNSANPLTELMDELRDPVHTAGYFLVIAGIVMVITLWKSKKAQSVTKTEVNLGRQFEGFERFESSMLSRILVRMNISLLETIKKIIPLSIQNFIAKRFDNTKITAQKSKDQPSFDLIRASVNLMVSSILISFATSLKLPLSTTYVTFMVAMGTSLSDKAWGRESAVYRVNGVLTVIGGWFFTAFMAFTVSAVFALVIYYGELPAIFVLIAVAIFFVYKTHIVHKDRSASEEESEKEIEVLTDVKIKSVKESVKHAANSLLSVSTVFEDSLEGLFETDRKKLKKAKKASKKIEKNINTITSSILSIVKTTDDEIREGHRYGKIVTSMNEISNRLQSITKKNFDHVDNNHKPLNSDQIDELKQLSNVLSEEVKSVSKMIEKLDFESKDFQEANLKFEKIHSKLDKNQVSRIKKGHISTRNSILYLGILSDTNSLSINVKELVHALKETIHK
ncbi:MAG: phosphate permease [Ignavibacteriae bacterium]|nr:phosphate permease [Ignavibacteriota bacterium]